MPDAVTGTPVRRWRVVAATVLLCVMGILSVRNGLSEHVEEATTAQRVAKLTELANGVFALASSLLLAIGSASSRIVLVAWAVTVTATAGLASVAWGGESLSVGLASAVGAALITIGIIYLSGAFRNTHG